MTSPIADQKIPYERLDAKQVAVSTYVPVGNHISGTFNAINTVTLITPDDAQFLKLQALTSNLRYRIDGNTSGTTNGFQLLAGSDVLIPVCVPAIRFIGEGNGTYEAQWVR